MMAKESWPAPVLGVVVPILNERKNIRILHERLETALAGVAWELIFVDDDSRDGSAEEVASLARENPRVRLLHRIGRSGLSSACVEGMMSSTATYLAVMDGDLQHDESILPKMLQTIQAGQLDMVVGSRNISGGSMGDFAAERVKLSNLGRWFSQRLMGCPLSDPMSGFFMLSRTYLLEVVHRLSQMGFKILLDLTSSTTRPLRYAEVPYTFRNREHGESKLDISVNLDFLLQIADKKVGHLIPARFALYVMVGFSGMVVHGLILLLFYRMGGMPLEQTQIFGTATAIVWNFFLNNMITYRDRKLKGWASLLQGLLVYVAGCGVGAFSNLALTRMLVEQNVPGLIAGMAGMAISSVWNFGMASALTWKISQRRKVKQWGN